MGSVEMFSRSCQFRDWRLIQSSGLFLYNFQRTVGRRLGGRVKGKVDWPIQRGGTRGGGRGNNNEAWFVQRKGQDGKIARKLGRALREDPSKRAPPVVGERQ